MLNQWNKHLPIPPLPPSATSPDSSDSFSTIFNAARVSEQVVHLNSVAGMISSTYARIKVDNSSSPSPWFIYAFMGVGVMLCCISCTGHIAAESINGCCLCFYSILKTLFILLEVALILFIALDHHWERDLPSDQTGEIDRIRKFIEANIDFCKWIGITVVVIQAVSLLLAVVLRSMVNLQMKDDIENDSEERGKVWEPLLNPRVTQASVSGDGKAFHSDIWSSRMREKYGLSTSNGK